MLFVLFCLLMNPQASANSDYLAVLTRAELLQEATLESSVRARALAGELSTLPDGWQDDALKRLSHSHTPPLVRFVLVEGLSSAPHVNTAAILHLLNASGDRQPLAARIDAVTILHARQIDAAAGPRYPVAAALDDPLPNRRLVAEGDRVSAAASAVVRLQDRKVDRLACVPDQVVGGAHARPAGTDNDDVENVGHCL